MMKKYSEVFNTQMVYDFDVKNEPGGKNYVTISRPVMERLISGRTKGLLIRPLGAIVASFFASENWRVRIVQSCILTLQSNFIKVRRGK